MNCPASRLTLPPRLSTRGRETGSNRRERVPVCDREVLSHHIWDYCIPSGEAKFSPCLNLSLLFRWTRIRMSGSGCLFDFQSDAPALILSGRLMDPDGPPTPNACVWGSQEPPGCKHLFLIEVLPLQSCLARHLNTERPLSDNSIVILLLLFVSNRKGTKLSLSPRACGCHTQMSAPATGTILFP